MRALALPRRALLVDALLLAAWLGAIGLALRHEQGHLWGGAINPLTLMRAPEDASEQWFGLYYKDRQIGYAQTQLFPEELDGVPGIAVVDRGRLAFNLLGAPQQLDVSSRVFIDANWRLQRFDAQLRSPTYQLTWTGRREGDHLVMTSTTPDGRYVTRLRDPGGTAFVIGLSPWAAFHHLSPGQWGTMWMLNPLALTPEKIYFHVRREEEVDGVKALVIETDFRGMKATSWVTRDGQVLRETSPLGWELRRQTREVARALPAEGSMDLLAATAVPIDRPLDQPERIRRLVLLVRGLDADDLARRPWQRALPPSVLIPHRRVAPIGPWCIVELLRPDPGAAANAPGDTVPPQGYDRPSPFVQSDDPRIQRQARQIVGAEPDPWRRALAIHEWVHRTLSKRLTVGLPSAVDVLQSKSGDCHEHTVLFTALARAAGLPTRMLAGVVYYDGRLFYHAWPEVWHGTWIPMDPTLGQPVADAAHLGLLEAESEALLSLGQFIGQLSVEVLELDE
jgi:hypothetical protein